MWIEVVLGKVHEAGAQAVLYRVAPAASLSMAGVVGSGLP